MVGHHCGSCSCSCSTTGLVLSFSLYCNLNIFSSSEIHSNESEPVLTFIDDDALQAFTCQAINVHWNYTGPSGSINLYTTNVGVPQTSSKGSSSTVNTSTTNITVTLGTNIDTSNSSFRWGSVDVPEGWYILNASMPAQSYSAQSDPFYVQTGNDTSCISSSTSNSKSANPSPHPDIIPIAAIIGASFGLTIVVATMVVAYIFFRKGRPRKSNRRTRKDEYPNSPHDWKGLGSVDSEGGLRGSQPRPYHQSPNQSLGTIIHSTQSDEGAEVEKSSIHSKLESTGLSCEEDVALSQLPVLQHQSSRSHTFAVDRPYSSSSSTTLGPSNHGHSSTSDRPARDGISNRRSLDSMAYPPTRPTLSTEASLSRLNRDPRASMPPSGASYDDSRSSLPPGNPPTVDATKQTNRQSFGRKRKPAPVYDGEEPASPSVPPLPTSPSSPFEAFLSASPSASNSVGHYVSRNHSLLPDQTYGGNFGPAVKPLHYLIPDMPVSPQ